MNATSKITDEVRQLIGTASEPSVTKIEAGAIARFAEAIGDDNPLFVDEEFARRTRFGGIVAPPTFIYTLRRNSLPDVPIDAPRLLNGGDEFEYFAPVRPGDVIVSVTRYADFYERKGGIGQMVFIISETSYTNQHGKLVAKHRGTRIRY